ncbi:MAG TPA: type II secretion system protein GspN [Candidatus Dormibacteraeota bacterium]|nr:type II secretion system protein GspN [Candidatus Dormibacteraeota bacterium]
MRVPALRLPAWRPSFDWADGLGSRSTILYALYTLVLFCVFLFANFPHKILVQRLLHSAQVPGLRLDVGDVRFAWWHGFELQRVLVAPSDPSLPAFFESPSLYVRPALSDLARARVQTVALNGSLYGGTFDGSLSGGEVNRVSLTFDGVQLQRYPMFATWLAGGQLAGRLSGAISVETHGTDIADVRAAGDLQLDGASVTDAKFNQFPIPPLHFKTAGARFDLQGGRLDVQELKADGSEITLDASGQVALRTPLADSVLNLKVALAPGPESPDDIKTLLSAVIPPPAKGAKADAPHTLSGTLAKPRLR